jgi:hypothetical protein
MKNDDGSVVLDLLLIIHVMPSVQVRRYGSEKIFIDPQLTAVNSWKNM